MKIVTVFLSLITLLGVSKFSPLQKKDDEKEIINTLISMWDAIEKGDVEKYATFVHPDYTSFGENDPFLNEGKELEIKGIRDWLKTSSNIHTEMHQPKVVIRGDVAWITYYWTDSGDNKDGSRFATRGKSTRIFVKEKGKWLCIHAHFTNVE